MISDQVCRLRKAKTSDLKPLWSFFQAEGIPGWTEKMLADELQQARSQTWLLEKSSTIEGFLMVRTTAYDHDIVYIAVSRNQRRQGLGTLILKTYLADVGDIEAVYLEVRKDNLAAQELYRKLGFEIIGSRKSYYPDGTDALSMKLNLAKP